jgi:hypothetical protein
VKPFAVAWLAINPRDEMIFFQEWPQSHYWNYTSAPGFGTEGYFDALSAIEDGDNEFGRPIRNVIWRIMDPNFGRTKKATTGRTVQEEFAEFGWWFDTNVDDDITAGHLAVRQRLEQGSLVFTPNCHNLVYAMNRYTYKESTIGGGYALREKPSDEYKDFPDLVRYACMSPISWCDTAEIGRVRSVAVRNMGFG